MSETERSDGVIPSLLRNEQAGDCSNRVWKRQIGIDRTSRRDDSCVRVPFVVECIAGKDRQTTKG